MIFQELPTPHELGDHPELASLAMLDTAIEVATHALAAQHPGLGFLDEHPGPIEPALVLSDAIVQQASALQALLGAYCRLTAKPLRTIASKASIVPPPDDF